ncbi:hypothetical protein D3C86_1879980 [compost metagenome]
MHYHGITGATVLEVRELFRFCRIGIVINKHPGGRPYKELIVVRKNSFNAPAQIHCGEIGRLCRFINLEKMQLTLADRIEKITVQCKTRH